MDSTRDPSDMTAQKPPRARVEDAVDSDAPRTRDYLDGFLAAKPAADAVGGDD